MGSYTCVDRLYALPQSLDPAYGVALVNTATAAQAGLTDIAAGWATWDELIADARAMAVGQGSGMTRAGFHFIGVKSLPAMFDSLILQNGGQAVTNGALTVNTPQGAAALGLQDVGKLEPGMRADMVAVDISDMLPGEDVHLAILSRSPADLKLVLVDGGKVEVDVRMRTAELYELMERADIA